MNATANNRTDTATLRALLSFARRTGWDHAIYGSHEDHEHTWKRGDVRVSIYGDELEVSRPGARRSLWCPRDIAEVVRVLIAAELLPAGFGDPVWRWCPGCADGTCIPWPHTHEVRRELVAA